MDGIMNAIKRFTQPVNHAQWSPAFSKMVQQVSVPMGTGGRFDLSISDRVGLLRKLEPYVKQHGFTNIEEEQIMSAKNDLLTLWSYLLEFVALMTKPSLKELGYSMIVMLMQREEFTLKRLGFKPGLDGPTCPPEHLVIARRYKGLLLETFSFVIGSMTAKGKFAEIIHFSAQSLVIFFFRLPLVGGRVIDALERKAANCTNEADSLEHLSKPANLTPNSLTPAERSTNEENAAFLEINPDLFEWNYFDTEEEAQMLSPPNLRDDSACLTWLSTKETFFLTFVEVYVMHVESVATHPVCWQTVPAYDLLLQCFWPLLKSSMWWDSICKRKTGEGKGWVSSLPAYMRVKRSALAILSNKALINHFISLTFQCTNLHSLLSIDSCVEHLNLWFSTVAYSSTAREGIVNHNQNSRNAPPKQTIINASDHLEIPALPAAFDYDNFWFGIRKLLSSDLFQALLKVCSLLYNTLHLFRGQLRIRFIGDIMNEFFIPLFLHWSAEVRTFFQLTLVYKVLRADRRNLPCFSDVDVIRDFGHARKKVNIPVIARNSHKRLQFATADSSSLAATTAKADEVSSKLSEYSNRVSFERRMAVFDDHTAADNEELLVDIMFCSKIDAYVRMCLDRDPSIPSERQIYIEASLIQYAGLLSKYYHGVTSGTSETLPLLAHRMVYSEFQSSE